MNKIKNNIPRIGITIGDINGIGPEVILKSLAHSKILDYVTPVIYGSTKTLSYYRKNFKLDDLQYIRVKDEEFIPKKINVVNCWEEVIEITVGQPTPEAARASRLSLMKAVEDLRNDKIDALVTGPINKHNIQSEDFNFPGHTEYLTKEFESKDSLMLLINGDLRIGVVTGHIPVSEISKNITTKKVRSKIDILESSLRKDFGINKPRIAVLGLNPHSSDKGLIGKEEEEILIPLIESLKNEGKLIFGPFPADGFFGDGKFRQYDGILAMYHDQGLIPFKTLAFETGVNFTAGLSIIRTSPDHGTAYSIAGTNVATESSMREAIFLAKDIWKNRIND
ncbi:MAG: 4-hydroxythreonine-4-phosphate dehydrogenase PdxA [Cyclobacteriaceae bacterium]|nr:4-hydroxythreonine-4-phosphate dehydrogenase PdxA [Cyclobacteriaceae bacterium]